MKHWQTSSGVAMDHLVIHRDRYAYSAHPHLAVAGNGEWLLVFTQSRRRSGILHPPQDPLYRNMLVRSADEGRSWTCPTVVPGFGWDGVECAGLTVLSCGDVLLNQWRFDWRTLADAEANLPREAYRRPEELMSAQAMQAELADWTEDAASLAECYPWARAGGATYVHRSHDHGRTFETPVVIDTAPFSGGYGMRGGVEIDGEILLPLCDVPNYERVFIVRSTDGGASWSAPQPVAAGDGHAFEEPAPLHLGGGRVLILLRDNITRLLHAVTSDDAGRSWSRPVSTGIADYPADLVALGDGRVACVTGRRREPFGITLYLSDDTGRTWNADTPVPVRDDLPNRDLGYPSAALRSDGSLFVAYYAQDADGVTGIHASVVPPDILAGRSGKGASHGEG